MTNLFYDQYCCLCTIAKTYTFDIVLSDLLTSISRSQISAVREKRRPEYRETKKTGGERINQSEQRTRA